MKYMKTPRGTARKLRRMSKEVSRPEDVREKEKVLEALLRAFNPLRWIGSDASGHFEVRMADGKWESRTA